MESSSKDPIEKSYPFQEPQRLRIYGFLSVDPSIASVITPDMAHKMYLTIVSAYNFEDAIISNDRNLRLSGKTDNIFPAFLSVWDYYDSLVPVAKIADIFNQLKEEHAKVLKLKDEELERERNRPKLEKEKETLAAYVRYVFGAVGTHEEIEIAEKVLSNFNLLEYGKQQGSI